MTLPARLAQGTPVTLESIGKGYGNRTVLDNIQLRISAGQFVAVVGRSGCGKSTLLRLLAGLEQPSSGALLSGNAPLAAAKEDTRLMFQDARLLPWKTVIDNVGLGCAASGAMRRCRRWTRSAWRIAPATGRRRCPAGKAAGRPARALIHRPRLLLLDEPLGALDALTRIEMQGLIETLWQQHGFTVLLVTHDVSEAIALADRVILIEEGRIGLDLTLDLPRPRQGSARLAELEAEVLERVLSPPATAASGRRAAN
ncbi:ATP-binding cassette domain-containing protein [Serratia ureilytica]